MRTADQIKRKLHELTSQKQALETMLTPADNPEARDRMLRLEDQIVLLEWVLNEPIGNYHT